MDRLRAKLDNVGRTIDEIQITVARDPESHDDVALWEKMGVQRLVLFPGSRATGGDTMRALEEFAAKFIEPTRGSWRCPRAMR